MKSWDHASIVCTLENIHARLCLVESTINSKDIIPDTIPPPSLFPPVRPTPPWPGHGPAPAQTPQRAQYYRDIANDINEKIKEIISRRTDLAQSRQYTEEIKNIIRPYLSIVRGAELKAELSSLFAREEWARGDRPTHAYVGIIWNALRELNLWN